MDSPSPPSSSVDDLLTSDGDEDDPPTVSTTEQEDDPEESDDDDTTEVAVATTPDSNIKKGVEMRHRSNSDVKETLGSHRRQIFSTGDIEDDTDSPLHDEDTLPEFQTNSNLDIEAQKYRRDLGRMKSRRKPSRNTIAGFSSLRDEWAFEDSTEVKKMYEDGMEEEENEGEEEPTTSMKTSRSQSGTIGVQLPGVNQTELLLGISRSRDRRHGKSETNSPSNSPRHAGDKSALQPSWMQEVLAKKKVKETDEPTAAPTLTHTRTDTHTHTRTDTHVNARVDTHAHVRADTHTFSEVAKSKAITRPPWLHEMHNKNSLSNTTTDGPHRESKLKSPVISPRSGEISPKTHLSPRPRLHPMSDLQKSPAVPRKPKPHEIHQHGPIRATPALNGVQQGRRSALDSAPARPGGASETNDESATKHAPTYSKSSVEFGFVTRRTSLSNDDGRPPRTETETKFTYRPSAKIFSRDEAAPTPVTPTQGSSSPAPGSGWFGRKLRSNSLEGTLDGDAYTTKRRELAQTKNIQKSFDAGNGLEEVEIREKRSKSEDSRKEERSKGQTPARDRDNAFVRTTFPQWQQDLIEKRRRSKDIATVAPMVRPPPAEPNNQSEKFANQQVPSWKKDLQEKRRSRLLQSSESENPSPVESRDEGGSVWRREVGDRKNQSPTPPSNKSLDVVGKENQNNSQQHKQQGGSGGDEQRPAWLKHIRVKQQQQQQPPGSQSVNNTSQQQHGNLNINNNNEPEWKMIALKMKAKRAPAGDNM